MRDPIIDKYWCTTLANLPTYRFHSRRKERNKGGYALLPDGIWCLQLLKPRYAFPPLHVLAAPSVLHSPTNFLSRSVASSCVASTYPELLEIGEREKEREKEGGNVAREILLYGNLEKYITMKMYKYEHRKTDGGDNIATRGVAHQYQNCMKISTIFANCQSSGTMYMVYKIE